MLVVMLGRKPQLERQPEQRRSEDNTEGTHPTLRSSAYRRGLGGSDSFSFEQQRLLQQQQQQQQQLQQQQQQPHSPSSSFDPDFPLPWQGNIDLPTSDEETMNAAQVG